VSVILAFGAEGQLGRALAEGVGRRAMAIRVADQHGCPTGAADIAEAILTIAPLLVRREPVWGTYHCRARATTWHGFASEIVDAHAVIANRHPAVVPISSAEYPTAAQRPTNSELDSSHFTSTFGMEAKDWRERTRQVMAALLS
jgi:dTDP-4-dehydrorhamnose reductase